MLEFGQILSELRIEHGMYQKELAAHLNVSISTISNYEKGNHHPDLDTLCKLANLFGVTTDYLLGRTVYRYNPENLNKHLYKDFTVADLVNTTLSLPTKEVRSMIDYLELLKLRNNHKE